MNTESMLLILSNRQEAMASHSLCVTHEGRQLGARSCRREQPLDAQRAALSTRAKSKSDFGKDRQLEMVTRPCSGLVSPGLPLC